MLDPEITAAMQFADQLRHAGFAIEAVSTLAEAMDLLGYPPEYALEIVRQCGADELFVTPFSMATFIQYLAAHIRLPRPLS